MDFSNAALYVAGIQTISAIVACASVSVLACWLAPTGGVSAVRTLALCSATGALLMHQPLRFGRAHGVTVVFASLQLAVPLYLGTLVVEQLIHTCTSDPSHAPSWRHIVFHAAVLAMVVSGFMRAKAPLAETDRPFILTLAALLIIAIMPPPAVALVGPLCEAVTIWEAAERIVRAFSFAFLYCVNVYASTGTTNLRTSDASVVFVRSASASLWVSGAMLWWLPLAVAQAAMVIHARATYNPSAPSQSAHSYKKIESSSSTDDEDSELGRITPRLEDPVAEQDRLLKQRPIYVDDAQPQRSMGKILVSASAKAAPATTPPLSSKSEPIGALAFQPVSMHIPAAEPTTDAFSACVAKAMANVPDNF